MPIVDSKFKPSFLLSNAHIQTIFSRKTIKNNKISYFRERLHTPDKDFIDLDWARTDSKRLIILSHGLEGSSSSPYIKNFVHSANLAGWDVLAWNLRGCSGTPNYKLKSYHSGSSDDLQLVFSHALFEKKYQQISLVGFSLGGNITLKFLGEQSTSIAGLINSAVAISVPCDLESSANKLNNLTNRYYLNSFISSLKSKLEYKLKKFPDYLPAINLKSIKNFYDFDNYYTAPVHGFGTAEEYWRQASSRFYLKDVAIPTLLINAKNDPFLTPLCFPVEIAKSNENLFLEMPKSGGHVGFKASKLKSSWANYRSLEFLTANAIDSAMDFTRPLKAA
jgi:predicted alpha/beta-fold hydrolase